MARQERASDGASSLNSCLLAPTGEGDSRELGLTLCLFLWALHTQVPTDITFSTSQNPPVFN